MSSEYLRKVLSAQNLADDSEELKALQEHRADVEKLLKEKFPKAKLTIRYGGSKAKGTLIKASYDLDVIGYFDRDETAAGETLKDIYDNVAVALQDKYQVERKTSALRLRVLDPNRQGSDLRIDVVPGRYTDDTKTDVYLHQELADKERLKTNLQTHIDHVRDSGVTDAIRLSKLWKALNAIGLKTFILELLVIDLLAGKTKWSLADQFTHVLTELRDNSEDLTVEDPANPSGNDLSEALDQHRYTLKWVAKRTLETIDSSGWEAVFGKVEEEAKDERVRRLQRAAAAAVPIRPYATGD